MVSIRGHCRDYTTIRGVVGWRSVYAADLPPMKKTVPRFDHASRQRALARSYGLSRAARGRLVFNQICAQCHHLFDTGGQVGPDITGANRSDLDYLLQNILFPNAVIPNEYRQTILETKDNRVLTGIVKSAEGPAYVLQTANELVTVPKGEVAKVDLLETSMMPEGLLAGVDPQAMRDLLYYLGRPGQVPLPTAK